MQLALPYRRVSAGARAVSDLLPCPFCGYEDVLIIDPIRDEDDELQHPAAIQCEDCNAAVIGDDVASAIEAWERRAQPATGARVTDEAVKSAMAAYDAACEDPVFTDCPTCLGHGFCMVGGEPDYCDTCGGAGEIAAPDDDMRCMRAALEAALAQRKAE